MKIKKTMTVKGKPGASGGAAINDRFKLDAVAPQAPVAGTISRKAAAFAFAAGVISFLLAGVLVCMLYDHWEFLMPA